MKKSFVEHTIKRLLRNRCCVSGSVITSSILGVEPYSGADVDLYLQGPKNDNELDELLDALTLTRVFFAANNFFLPGEQMGTQMITFDERMTQLVHNYRFEQHKESEKKLRECKWPEVKIQTKIQDYDFTKLLAILTFTRDVVGEGR